MPAHPIRQPGISFAVLPIAITASFGLLIFYQHHQGGRFGQVSKQIQASLSTLFGHPGEKVPRILNDDQTAVSQKRHGQGIRLQGFKAKRGPLMARCVQICHGWIAKPSLETGNNFFNTGVVIPAQQVEGGFCLTAHTAPNWRWYG